MMVIFKLILVFENFIYKLYVLICSESWFSMMVNLKYPVYCLRSSWEISNTHLWVCLMKFPESLLEREALHSMWAAPSPMLGGKGEGH